jgi:hypothetical protein
MKHDATRIRKWIEASIYPEDCSANTGWSESQICTGLPPKFRRDHAIDKQPASVTAVKPLPNNLAELIFDNIKFRAESALALASESCMSLFASKQLECTDDTRLFEHDNLSSLLFEQYQKSLHAKQCLGQNASDPNTSGSFGSPQSHISSL